MIVPKQEIRWNIKPNDVKNAVQGVIKFASDNPQLEQKLFKEDFPIFIQINSFKIPKTHGTYKQVFRIPLANSPLPEDADICLIVPDVKGIPNKEHERHLQHYESLLSAKGVKGIKKIMTFHEFRTDYDTFELKNRLVDLYDFFLVDGKISGKVVHKCGSIFYKKRKVPLSIKLHVPNLNSVIEKSLKRTFVQLHFHSDSHIVQIGHSNMKAKSLIENVYSVVEFIDKHFPGKMENIRNLNIYAHRGSSIPIYISLKNPNEIEVPQITTRKSLTIKTVSGELSTQYNASVVVKPTGEVKVRRKRVREPTENLNENQVKAEKTENNDIHPMKKIKIKEESVGGKVSDKKKIKLQETQETNKNKIKKQKNSKKTNLKV